MAALIVVILCCFPFRPSNEKMALFHNNEWPCTINSYQIIGDQKYKYVKTDILIKYDSEIIIKVHNILICVIKVLFNSYAVV